jgi:hypothetical protein
MVNPISLRLRSAEILRNLVSHGCSRLRQLGDVGGDAPGLVAGEQLGGGATSWFCPKYT